MNFINLLIQNLGSIGIAIYYSQSSWDWWAGFLIKPPAVISLLWKGKRCNVSFSRLNRPNWREARAKKINTLGFDMQRRPRAKGTAWRIFCSPYCKRCSNERIAISSPNSSAIATIAIPSTAGPWWVSLLSRCCEQWPRRFWTYTEKSISYFGQVKEIHKLYN